MTEAPIRNPRQGGFGPPVAATVHPARPPAGPIPSPASILALLLALFLALALSPAAPAQEPVILIPVAELAQPAPGFSGLVFEAFGTHPTVEEALGGDNSSPPLIDAHGNVSFHAYVGADGVVGESVEPPFGVFRLRDGVLEAVARAGDAAPGTGRTFEGFPGALPVSPDLDAGVATFIGDLDPQVLADENGLWSERFASGIARVAVPGDPLPGMAPGASLGRMWGGSSEGTVFATGRIVNSGTGDRDPIGLWRADGGGALQVIAATGLPAPGTGGVFGQIDGQLLGPIGSYDFAGGRVALTGFVKAPDLDIREDEGVWVETGPAGSGLELLVREGDRVPGDYFPRRSTFESGSVTAAAFSGTNTPGIRVNAAGEVVFHARVDPHRGAGVPSVWTTRGGSLRLVLAGEDFFVGASEPGMVAPGTGGSTFTIPEAMDLNDRGDLLVRSQVALPGTDLYTRFRGAWIDRGSGLEAVAIDTFPVPGNAGATFAGLGQTVLEDDGTVLFTAAVEGSDATPRGLFAATPDGAVRRLLAVGDPIAIEGAAGERTVAGFILGAGRSDAGEKAVDVTFGDGSAGIYRVGLPGGPAPGPDPAERMHVAGVDLSQVSLSRGFKQPAATVEIVDEAGAPVSGALVAGRFGGSIDEAVSGTTGADGTAVLVPSGSVKGGLEATFCVESVSHDSLVHDPGADAESCDSL